MQPQTPLILGSVSKSVTALAAMQLVDAGKLDLDAPVQKYLPRFQLTDADAARALTVRMLLNQTSGLPTGQGREILVDATRSLEDVVYSLRNLRPARPPGQAYEYSNLNYSVLGLIIQTVSGEPYGQYMQENVFGPLQMRHSYASLTEAQKDLPAEGHQTWFGLPVVSRAPAVPSALPGGYLVSTAEDMSHFLIAQLNAGRYSDTAVVSGQAIDLMHQPAAKVNATEGYGMGWAAVTIDGAPALYHDGQVADFTSELVLLPGTKIGVVMLFNVQHQLLSGAARRIALGVVALMQGRMAPAGGNPWLGLQLAALATILLLAWSLESLRRWPALVRSTRRGARMLAIAVVVFQAVIAAAVGFGCPAVTGVSWGVVQLFAPDIARLLEAVVIVNAIGSLARSIIAVNLWRKREPSWKSSHASSAPTTD
jgi:CubicO group peptidase (beta-lactamase class C family)